MSVNAVKKSLEGILRRKRASAGGALARYRHHPWWPGWRRSRESAPNSVNIVIVGLSQLRTQHRAPLGLPFHRGP
jgi:hypothetical protein